MDYHFIIVGCGGTGGNFIKEFARFLYSGGARSSGKVKVTIVDGDIVEEKNIARQPFTKEDVGLKKAEAMCQAIYDVFGLSFEYYEDYIDSFRTLKSLCSGDEIPVIIGAVDNHAARKVMHEYFEKSSSCIYLDSANEYSYGELVIGAKLDGHTVYPDRTFYFPEVLADTSKSRSEMGCEELNQASPQHITTNIFAANLLLTNVALLLTETKINGGIYYFDMLEKGYCRFERFSNFQEVTLLDEACA